VANPYAAMAKFLGGFPENYLVFDCETQGLNVMSEDVLAVQLGYCLVENRVAIEHGSLLLDWSRPGTGIDPSWFRMTLENTKNKMTSLGKPFHTDWDLIRAQGHHPVEALEAFRDLLVMAVEGGYGFCGHNAYRFDRRLVERLIAKHASAPFVFPSGSILDTGLIEKSFGVARPLPDPAQCVRDAWYETMADLRSTVKWSLDSACASRYDLFARGGVDPGMAHDAGADCVLTHHLMEAMRERSEVV
jgi:hypothetical protein